METVEKKYYVCDICGRTSQDQEKIEICQQMHRDVVTGTNVEANYRKGKPYPHSIVFVFEDGTWAEYRYNCSKDAEGYVSTFDS